MRGRTIWLVGMMGAGKSAVGRALAARLGRAFVDADAEIETRAGRTIARIFAEEGEAAFRKREREEALGLRDSGAVVALGGGAFSQPGLADLLAAAGPAVWLRARPETLARRVGEGDERPLLRGLGGQARAARLAELLRGREADYARAEVVVDTDALGVEAVAAAVARALGEEAVALEGAVSERTVEVELGDRSYPIRIGCDTLPELGPEVARVTGASRALLVTVPEVGRRYAGVVVRSLREAGIRTHRFDVPDGDRTKNLREVARLYDAMLDAGADRSSVVVALGGGMVGDLAGFVAATLLRGLAFVQVPTTILAMIDSSVGGKTGVNLPRGKNLVGAFHQPRLVFEDTAVLRSLPRRVRAAGLAEVVKHGAIWDAGLFARLERDVERVLDLDDEVLVPVLEAAVRVKAQVVALDEREQGVRALLNFGHTLGHAAERLKRYRGLLHGEAVAMGMVFAARLSEARGFAPEGTATRLESLLVRAGLPTELPAFPRRAYLEALMVDKKRRDAHIRFVVLSGIGKATTTPLEPREILPPRWRPGAE